MRVFLLDCFFWGGSSSLSEEEVSDSSSLRCLLFLGEIDVVWTY